MSLRLLRHLALFLMVALLLASTSRCMQVEEQEDK